MPAALALLLAAVALRSQESATTTLAPELRQDLDTALASQEPLARLEQLWRTAMLRDGDVAQLLGELTRRAEDPTATPAARHAALRLGGRIAWRQGNLARAATLLGRIPEAEETADDLQARAEVLDALGRNEAAIAAYDRLLRLPIESGLQHTILVRKALLQGEAPAGDRPPLALFAARQAPGTALRNQAAIVLALLGSSAEAIELFAAGGTDAERFREEVRLAEWAMDAKALDQAQDFAWRATRSAKLRRDRFYALTLLAEAHRRRGQLPALLERFAATPDLDAESRQTWIDLLRETGQTEAALRLFRATAAGFTIEGRRQLLEICRETGQEATLVETYRQLIAEEPTCLEWREGLARYHLERGDRASALAVVEPYVALLADDGQRLAAAASFMDLGLDDLAMRLADQCRSSEATRQRALLFLFELNRERGRLDQARAALFEVARTAPADAPVRRDLADAYARIGSLRPAIDCLESFCRARGERSDPDTRMELALLLSQAGDEEQALGHWQELWRQIDSVPRRRYVEERLTAVAARLGKLAAIAIELERRLAAGTADDREAGLLVRIYMRANDPLSATEIVQEHMQKRGVKTAEVLKEKARVFRACNDYYNYEKVMHELIDADPEGRVDHLRELAMSCMERGQRREARAVLARLENEATDAANDEFEAGVLALAGLRDEAIRAYQRTLAANPNRIDTYLLLANLLRDVGQRDRATGMFQYLAQTADKDDLFTVAIDGILNMRGPQGRGVPNRTVEWARRTVLERIARRDDKLYLYRLVADLSEEIADAGTAMRALKAAIPIAGEQRTALLRELLAMAARQPDEKVAIGRRILGQGELVPPEVYLALGEAFLAARDAVNARRTFEQMSRLPEYGELQRKIAEAFEMAAFPKEALRVYERMLAVETSDVDLMAKVGELTEETGRDEAAFELYARGFDLLLRRSATTGGAARPADPRPLRTITADEFDLQQGRLMAGLLATLPDGPAGQRFLAEQAAACDEDLAAARREPGGDPDRLALHPRLLRRVAALRRLAVAADALSLADQVDQRLLVAFPDDTGLLDEQVRFRVRWGQLAAARALIETSGRPDAERRRLQALAAGASTGPLPDRLTLAEAAGQSLRLLAHDRVTEAHRLLERVEVANARDEDREAIPPLLTASIMLGRKDLTQALCRQWLGLIARGQLARSYQDMDQLLGFARAGLDQGGLRDLLGTMVDQAVTHPVQLNAFVSRLAMLRPLLGDLLTREQVESLIKSRLDTTDQLSIYGLDQLLACLPAAERVAVFRTVWPKVPASHRATLLFDVLRTFDTEVEPSFRDFLVGAFAQSPLDPSALGVALLTPDRLVVGLRANFATALGFLDVMRQKTSGDVVLEGARALVLARLGRGPEAVAAAKAFFDPGRETSDPRSAAYQRRLEEPVLQAFEKGPAQELLAMLAAQEEADSRNAAQWRRRRLAFLARTADAARHEALLREAVAAAPADGELQVSLAELLRGQDRLAEAADQLEAYVKEVPRDARARAVLAGVLRELDHPLRARALGLDAGLAAAGSRRAAGTVLNRAQAATIAATVAQAATTTTRLVGGRVVTTLSPAGRLQEIKKHWTAGDFAAACREYRQLWRSYGSRRLPVGIALPTTVAMQPWPADAGAPARKAPEVLVEQPAGLVEVRRQLRSLEPPQLGSDGASDLFRALVSAESKDRPAAALLDEMMAAERGGTLGRLGQGRLYALLEAAPAATLASARPSLEACLASAEATDATSLRRLARLFAQAGDQQKAATLYGWCALVSSRPLGAAPDPGLVREVTQTLAGAERERAIEVVLAAAGQRTTPDQQATLALETWRDVVGPDRALEKAASVVASLRETAGGPRRRACALAAPLLARKGRLDEAIACLEIALCDLDRGPDPSIMDPYALAVLRSDPTGRGLQPDLGALFPDDTAGWQDPAAWFETAATRMREWHAAGRLRAETLHEALPRLAARLHECGRGDAAARVLSQARSLAASQPRAQVALCDAARRLGQEELATAIERDLLARRALPVAAIAPVIDRVAASAGSGAALALAEAAAAYTLRPDLVERILGLAKALGDAERLARWEGVQKEAAAARLDGAAPRPERRGRGTR